MKRLRRSILFLFLTLGLILGSLNGCSIIERVVQQSHQQVKQTQSDQQTEQTQGAEARVEKGNSYDTKDEVALYLHLYQELPPNYLTKKEAENLGWDNRKGNLWEVAPGASIGGSKFGNYEKRLPEKSGRQYYECDIDYEGGYRNAKRIVYSNDGLVYYTEDHYETFEQLYGQTEEKGNGT